MKSSSDSEDDVHMKQLLEAADPGLFHLYQQNQDLTVGFCTKDVPKSQRVINNLDNSADYDFKITDSMKNYVYKKMAFMIEQSIEFEHNACLKKTFESKPLPNGIKLLRAATSFIETNTNHKPLKRALVKPVTKRRSLESIDLKEKEKLSLVAVSGDIILNGNDTKQWAQKYLRNVFYYKKGPKGILYLQEKRNIK